MTKRAERILRRLSCRFFATPIASASRPGLSVLDSQQKKDFFAAIDMFAMPSFSDSFGLVFLEAWANGIPNVAYRAGGVAGVIRHEVDGLLVRCGDLNGLAQALNHMAKDK